jgi:hypothetical protein
MSEVSRTATPREPVAAPTSPSHGRMASIRSSAHVMSRAPVDVMASLFQRCEKEFHFLIEKFGCKRRANQTDASTYGLRHENKQTIVLSI